MATGHAVNWILDGTTRKQSSACRNDLIPPQKYDLDHCLPFLAGCCWVVEARQNRSSIRRRAGSRQQTRTTDRRRSAKRLSVRGGLQVDGKLQPHHFLRRNWFTETDAPPHLFRIQNLGSMINSTILFIVIGIIYPLPIYSSLKHYQQP